ncbi:MAG: alpha/beta hydrolase [Myxococcota bacterium]
MSSPLHPAELASLSGGADSLADRLLTGLGAAIDGSVLMGMQRAVDSLMMPSDAELPELMRSAEEMRSDALLRDPGLFFDFDENDFEPLDVRVRRTRLLTRGRVERTRLRLRYRPHAATAAGAGAGEPGEVEVPVERWRHDGVPAATVIALHGFTMGNPRIDSVVLMAGHWYRAGLDVALVTLPHHGVRTPEGARFSGESFAVPHVTRLADAVRQASFELLALRRWLAGDRGAPAGALGLSLGGYLTALLAALDPGLAFAVPMAPPVCIGDLAWRFFERSGRRERGAAPALARSDLREAFRAHSPLAHGLAIDRRRLLIVAGRGDRIVPPEHPQSLYLHWGAPDIHWFNGGHLAPFGRSAIIRAVQRHWRQLDLR